MAGVRGACGRCDDGDKPGLSRGGRGRVRSAGGLSSGKKSPSCAVMSMRCGRVWTLRGDKSPLLPPLSGPAPGCRCPATGRADMMSESRSGNPYTLLCQRSSQGGIRRSQRARARPCQGAVSSDVRHCGADGVAVAAPAELKPTCLHPLSRRRPVPAGPHGTGLVVHRQGDSSPLHGGR